MVKPIEGRIGPLADRPNRGDYFGSRYLATDNGRQYEWNGAAWLEIDTFHEGFSIGANAMASTAAYTFTNGLPRLVFPDGVTTDAYVCQGFPNDWLGEGVTVGFDWDNDHSAGGNVRWQFQLKGVQVGGLMSGADVLFTQTQTIAAPTANGGHITSIIAADVPIVSGAFGSLFTLRMTRLGADGADTLAGPVGLAEVVFLKSDL